MVKNGQRLARGLGLDKSGYLMLNLHTEADIALYVIANTASGEGRSTPPGAIDHPYAREHPMRDATVPQGFSSASDQTGAAKPQHVRLAILTLFLLAPLTAEVLSNSTPLLVFLTNPILAILNLLLYGCGALVIREVARRRALGWASILWLGAAYGIFEEGVVLNTWADPWSPQVCTFANGVASGLCDYSRVMDINLLWAISVTAYHAVISIALPILLVELIFPLRATRPWLGRKAVLACIVGELAALAAGLSFAIADFQKHGLAGPPPEPYLIELALMAAFAVLALRLRPYSGAPSMKRLPRLTLLRAFAFFFVPAVVFLPSLWKASAIPFAVALGVEVALTLLVIWRISTWSRRAGWGERQMLALGSGVLGFFILVWDPFLELAGNIGGKSTRGTLLVAAAYLVLLIILARRTARRLRQVSPVPAGIIA